MYSTPFVLCEGHVSYYDAELVESGGECVSTE